MLEVKELACMRDERCLFSGLNFAVAAGELVQVEGRNGAGKTTLIRILTGLMRPDEGQVTWHGEPINEVRDEYHHALLYIGHQAGVKPELTVLENLSYYQEVSQSGRCDLAEAIRSVGLFGYEDVMASQLSAGQQRRVALARLWMSEHPLWVLDEPFTAIDKRGVEILQQLFMRHAEQGGSVILTSHQALSSVSCRRISLEGV
uniref:cytochrome c biogenesis heme-transporting ATPase CcmA n=1 Tax=Thaumasiovibrio occultus TaxID=1891184 RepID=UPI000B3600D5|nr:cytochrome c biogenesis heme-transporting ATPase CcmA [Thaumasiovibrio occultus]